MTDTIKVEVFRGEGGHGGYQSFDVPRMESQTVLDVVTHIQRKLDTSLAYRFACRVGMCGSCAMMVNGSPRWTCRTHVGDVVKDGRLKIAPLRNLPHIRDLAADLVPFFDKMQKAGGCFVAEKEVPRQMLNIDPQSPARMAVDAGIECIGCAVCYAACDVVAWAPDYVGPAALNRAWTLVNDERVVDTNWHLQQVALDGGCMSCHSQGACSVHCPKSLNPSQSITGLKRAVARAFIKGEL